MIVGAWAINLTVAEWVIRRPARSRPAAARQQPTGSSRERCPSGSPVMTTTETRYMFRVDGHLDDHWSAWLDGARPGSDDDGTTTLTGSRSPTRHSSTASSPGCATWAPPWFCAPWGTVSYDGVSQTRVRRTPPRAARQPTRPALRTDDSPSGPPPPTTPRRRSPIAGSKRSSGGSLAPHRPGDLPGRFTDPARLAATVIVGHDGRIIGDFMLRVEDAWAQAEVADQARGGRPSSAGSSTLPSPDTATPPKPLANCSASASRTPAYAASSPAASWTTTRRGG